MGLLGNKDFAEYLLGRLFKAPTAPESETEDGKKEEAKEGPKEPRKEGPQVVETTDEEKQEPRKPA